MSKRDGSDLHAQATGDNWREDNRKALKRIVSLKEFPKSMIGGRDERSLAVHIMVQKSISQTTIRYEHQMTSLRRLEEKREENLGMNELLGGLVEPFGKEVPIIESKKPCKTSRSSSSRIVRNSIYSIWGRRR